MAFDFKDKVVLITGAGAGLGYACAVAFANAGAKIAITDISQDALDKAVDDLNARVPRCWAYSMMPVILLMLTPC